MTGDAVFQLCLHSITRGADGVLLFELRSPTRESLPGFEPGSHVDLHLPDGLVRSYSLMNDAGDRQRYVLGIKREEPSRGGSSWMHETARVGDLIYVARPRNHFSLLEAAPHSILIAGGIGITPLWCMVQRLQTLGRSWELHYRARRRAAAPLLEELTAPAYRERVHLSFSEDAPASRLDLPRVVGNGAPGSHFYCCGPVAMIESFQDACDAVEPERVHFEYFAAKEAPATAGGFTVRLARSGRDITVAPGQTVLDCLRACGIQMASSCQQGVCGACETAVVSGSPDHRDLVLTDSEKAEGRTMMVCCSGSLSEVLVLDI